MAARRLDHALARQLWDAGLPADEIAARIQSTANGVHALAHWKQWPRRAKGPSRRKRHARWVEAERLWRAGTPVREIAQRVGFTHESSVRHLAYRFGWPKRGPNRDTTAATRAVLARSDAIAAVQVARLEAALAAHPRERRAELWRCRCGGRATDPAGHPQCREAA